MKLDALRRKLADCTCRFDPFGLDPLEGSKRKGPHHRRTCSQWAGIAECTCPPGFMTSRLAARRRHAETCFRVLAGKAAK